MSSSLTLIQAISPCLIGLSFILPFVYGWVKKSWFSALSIGWCLALLSALLAPVYARLTQLEMIGKEDEILPVEPPSFILVLALGWILPLAGYFLAKYLRKLKDNRV